MIIFFSNYLSLIKNERPRGKIAKTNFHSQFCSYLSRVIIFVEPTVYILSGLNNKDGL